MQRVFTSIIHVILALLGALLLFSIARPTAAAASCTNRVLVAPAATTRLQVITDTIQPGSNLFLCRVDGVGALTNDSGVGTRNVTTGGLFLLVVARWLHFVGYALGFGTIAFSLWAATPGDQLFWKRRLWQLVNIGIVLLLCAEPLALLAQTIGVRDTLFDLAVAGDVLASGFGLVWAQRVGIALLLWVITGVVKDGSIRTSWAVPALALVAAIVDAIAGTSGVNIPQVAIAAATLHEMAMSVWIGGLALLLVLWKSLEREQRNVVLIRFGQLSGASIGALTITGLVMAIIRLTRLEDLIVTFYGAILAVKLLVALLVIALATFGQRRHFTVPHRRLALAMLVVVLGVTSLLVSVPSP